MFCWWLWLYQRKRTKKLNKGLLGVVGSSARSWELLRWFPISPEIFFERWSREVEVYEWIFSTLKLLGSPKSWKSEYWMPGLPESYFYWIQLRARWRLRALKCHHKGNKTRPNWASWEVRVSGRATKVNKKSLRSDEGGGISPRFLPDFIINRYKVINERPLRVENTSEGRAWESKHAKFIRNQIDKNNLRDEERTLKI